jgi:hypothetical protein
MALGRQNFLESVAYMQVGCLVPVWLADKVILEDSSHVVAWLARNSPSSDFHAEKYMLVYM